MSDGGLVIDLREMRGLAIDLKGHTAWAETGLTTGESRPPPPRADWRRVR